MRLMFLLFVWIVFALPAMADEINSPQKPALIKGSKSYQVRYIKTDKAPETIEPAGGDEVKKPVSQDAVKHMGVVDQTTSKQSTKLPTTE